MLMIMASRRTPEGLVERVCAKLPPDAVMLPQQGEPNVYPGILGMAQAVIVSSDSVNMATEAAITGKPVMIAPWRPRQRPIPAASPDESAPSMTICSRRATPCRWPAPSRTAHSNGWTRWRRSPTICCGFWGVK